MCWRSPPDTHTLFLSVASCLKLSSPSLEESSKTYKESLRSPINLCPSRAYKCEDTTILAVPEGTQQSVGVGKTEAAHLPKDPETGHVLTGGSPTGGGEQSNSGLQGQTHPQLSTNTQQLKQSNNPGRHAPSALLLVALQTFIIRFGPLRFADRLRFQQSASQGLWIQ